MTDEIRVAVELQRPSEIESTLKVFIERVKCDRLGEIVSILRVRKGFVLEFRIGTLAHPRPFNPDGGVRVGKRWKIFPCGNVDD
ncbi:hypothetical protein D3C87_1423230 [compost metagenome]